MIFSLRSVDPSSFVTRSRSGIAFWMKDWRVTKGRALPRLFLEPPGRNVYVERPRFVFEFLKGGAKLFAQAFEPRFYDSLAHLIWSL